MDQQIISTSFISLLVFRALASEKQNKWSRSYKSKLLKQHVLLLLYYSVYTQWFNKSKPNWLCQIYLMPDQTILKFPKYLENLIKNMIPTHHNILSNSYTWTSSAKMYIYEIKALGNNFELNFCWVGFLTWFRLNRTRWIKTCSQFSSSTSSFISTAKTKQTCIISL